MTRERMKGIRANLAKATGANGLTTDRACRVNSFGLIARALQLHGAVTFCASTLLIVLYPGMRRGVCGNSAHCDERAGSGTHSTFLLRYPFLIGYGCCAVRLTWIK
jgi:hypothetical protein